MTRLWLLLLPELRQLPRADQAAALKRARETPHDVVELLGTIAALVATTAFTRIILEGGMADRFASTVLNFVVALPMLAVLLAPLQWRRLRRGLRVPPAGTPH